MKTAAKDFKMTELGPVPKDWVVKSYEDVFTHIPAKGYQVAAEEYLQGGAYPVVDQGQEPIVGFCNQKEKVYSAGNDGVIVFGDHTRIVKFVDFDFVVGADGTQLLKGKECSTRYLAYILSVLDIPNLGYSRHFKYVKKANFAIPPLPEQRKIAAALSDVDEMIAALEKLIEKKRKIKTGAMQRLLTGKTRLPGFKGAWVEKRLGDVFEFHSNNTLSRASMIEGRGQIYNIHYGDVLIRYGAVLDCNKTAIPCLDDAASSVCKRDFLKDGDVIIADTAEDETVGKAVEVINVGDRLIVSGLHTIFLRPKEGTFALGWLGYYVNSTAFHDQLLPLITGIKVSSISKGSLMDTVLRCPSTLAEQKAIAKVLGDMDEEIATLEAELAKTRQLKQGMMQELLTGKTRLI